MRTMRFAGLLAGLAGLGACRGEVPTAGLLAATDIALTARPHMDAAPWRGTTAFARQARGWQAWGSDSAQGSLVDASSPADVRAAFAAFLADPRVMSRERFGP